MPRPPSQLFSFGMTPGYSAEASTSAGPGSSPQFSSTAMPASSRGTPPSSSSPYSPFPFGSPITHSRRSVLNPGVVATQGGGNETMQQPRKISPIQTRVKLRGRDLYGGPITFGGGDTGGHSSSLLYPAASSSAPTSFNAASSMASSLRRSNRLLSAAPYNASMRMHNRSQRSRQSETASAERPGGNSIVAGRLDHETAEESSANASGMSSTAKLILDTLEKMSTPVKDAQKIPLAAARAEKRRAIAEQLLERSTVSAGGSAGSSPVSASSASSSNYSRRRPRLGRITPTTGSATGKLLNGPPLRTVYTPVASSSTGSAGRKSAEGGSAKSASFAGNASERSKLAAATSRKESPAGGQQLPFPIPALQQTPTSSSSGKIRAKVGEKAKMRAEKTLFDGVDAETKDSPVHLQNASENPFLKMNAMPKFSFEKKSPESIISSLKNFKKDQPKPAFKDLGSSSDNRHTPSQSLQNSKPELPGDKPLVNKQNTDFLQKQVKNSAAGDTALWTTETFVFSRPAAVSRPTTVDLAGSSSYSYAFSSPEAVTVKHVANSDLGESASAASPPSLSSSSSSSSSSSVSPKSQNLPDLTRGGQFRPSSSSNNSSGGTAIVNNGKKEDAMAAGAGNSVGSLGVFSTAATTAGKLKAGSVMDILSGGNHKPLPDVAASAGKLSSPVKILAQDNVLDILKRDAGTGSWTPNFSEPKKPWQ